MNVIAGIAFASLATGILASIAWVALWTVAFPEAWSGYDVFTVPVFLLCSLAGLAVTLWSMLMSSR